VKGKNRFDYILLIVTLALVGIGIVMVYSSSAIMAGDRFGDPYFFLKKQILYAGIGFVLMILMMFFPYEVLKRLASYPHPLHLFLDRCLDPGHWISGGRIDALAQDPILLLSTL